MLKRYVQLLPFLTLLAGSEEDIRAKMLDPKEVLKVKELIPLLGMYSFSAQHFPFP